MATRLPSPKTIDAQLTLLRLMAEHHHDAVTRRVAWEVEHAIRWATRKTSGWVKPAASVPGTAELIRMDQQEGPA